MQKYVNLVDLVKSFPTRIYLQKSASIQPRTSLSKLGGKFNSLFIRLLSDDIGVIGDLLLSAKFLRPNRSDEVPMELSTRIFRYARHAVRTKEKVTAGGKESKFPSAATSPGIPRFRNIV